MPADVIVVNDVPLIVENGLSDRYHLVLVAGAEETERLRRLTQHRGMSEADARARIRAQANDDERAAVADVWIDSGAPKEDVAAIVTDLWHQRLVPFARHIATGRRAPRAEGPVELVTSPSPPRTWAVQA